MSRIGSGQADVFLDGRRLGTLRTGKAPAIILLRLEGAVTFEQGVHAPDGACTDDYNPYRMVLAVDRERNPEAGDLPTEDVTIDGIANGRIGTYPDESLTEQGGAGAGEVRTAPLGARCHSGAPGVMVESWRTD